MNLKFLFKWLAYVGATVRSILSGFSNVLWMFVAIFAFKTFSKEFEFEIIQANVLDNFILFFNTYMGWILISLIILFLYLNYAEVKNVKKEENKKWATS